MPEIDDNKDGAFAIGRVPGRFYISRSFPYVGDRPEDPLKGRGARFAYTVVDATTDAAFQADGGWDLVLRETPTRREQLKAIFFEDSREVPTLTFQRFDRKGKRVDRESFTLHGDEISVLETFIALIRSPGLVLDEQTQDDRIRVTPELAQQMLASHATLFELLRANPAVLEAFMRSDVDAPELAAWARRRNVVEEFERLLSDTDHFEEARRRTPRQRDEDVWQQLIERDPWIIGSSLAPQFLHAFSPAKLEQTVRGASLAGGGKRPDAVMRTAGAVSSIVLVEIKHHRTPLIGAEARSDCWQITKELAAGIAQCQGTAQATERVFEPTAPLRTAEGHRSGDVFVCRPRTILVAGSLDEFKDEDGHLHYEKFESFERFRRSLRDPEIITFDELFERARLVVTLSEEEKPAS